MKKIFTVFVFLVLIAGFSSAVCTGTQPPANNTANWTLQNDTKCVNFDYIFTKQAKDHLIISRGYNFTCENCSIIFNSTSTGHSKGIQIFNGSVRIINSTIKTPSTNWQYAYVFLIQGSKATLINNTFKSMGYASNAYTVQDRWRGFVVNKSNVFIDGMNINMSAGLFVQRSNLTAYNTVWRGAPIYNSFYLVDNSRVRIVNITEQGIGSTYAFTIRSGSWATITNAYLNNSLGFYLYDNAGFSNFTNFNYRHSSPPGYHVIFMESARGLTLNGFSIRDVYYANRNAIYVSGTGSSIVNLSRGILGVSHHGVNINNIGAIYVSSVNFSKSSMYDTNKYNLPGIYVTNTSRIGLQRIGMKGINGTYIYLDNTGVSVPDIRMDKINISGNMNVASVGIYVIGSRKSSFSNINVSGTYSGMEVSNSIANVTNVIVKNVNMAPFTMASITGDHVINVYSNGSSGTGLVFSDVKLRVLSRIISARHGQDGMYASHSNFTKFANSTFRSNNGSGIVFFDTSDAGYDISSIGNDLYGWVLAGLSSAKGALVTIANNGKTAVIESIGSVFEFFPQVFSGNSEGDIISLFSLGTVNTWGRGSVEGIGGGDFCTGRWCYSTSNAPIPLTKKSVISLTANGLPTYVTNSVSWPVGSTFAYYPGLSDPQTVTRGYYLYYAWYGGDSKWYLVQHNIISDTKKYVSLWERAGKMNAVYQLLNYKEGIIVLGRSTDSSGGIPAGTTSRCVEGLSQVWYFDEDMITSECLTCVATGVVSTYSIANKACLDGSSPCLHGCGQRCIVDINNQCIRVGGVPQMEDIPFCTVGKQTVYDLNNWSMWESGVLPAKSDCKKSDYDTSVGIGYGSVLYVSEFGPKSMFIGSDNTIYLMASVGYENGFNTWSGAKYMAVKNGVITNKARYDFVRNGYADYGAQGRLLAYGDVLHSGGIWINLSAPYQSAWKNPNCCGPPIGIFTGLSPVVFAGTATQYSQDKYKTLRSSLVLSNMVPDTAFNFPGAGAFSRVTLTGNIPSISSSGTLKDTTGANTVTNSQMWAAKDGAFAIGGTSGGVSRVFAYSPLSSGNTNALWSLDMPSFSGRVYVTGDYGIGWSGVVMSKYNVPTNLFTIVSDNIPLCGYNDYQCGDGVNKGGRCNDLGDPTVFTGSVGWTAADCRARLETGVACSSNAQCKTNLCKTGVCTQTHYCDMGYSSETKNYCIAAKADGSVCTRNAQCQSGKCLNGTYLDYTGILSGNRPSQYWGMPLNIQGGVVSAETVTPQNWVEYGVCVPQTVACIANMQYQPKRFINSVTQDNNVWTGWATYEDVICPWDDGVVNKAAGSYLASLSVNSVSFLNDLQYCDMTVNQCVKYTPGFVPICNDGYYEGSVNPAYVRIQWPYEKDRFAQYGVYVGTTSNPLTYLATVATPPEVISPPPTIVPDPEPTCSEITNLCHYDFSPAIKFGSRPGSFFTRVVGSSSETTTFDHMSDKAIVGGVLVTSTKRNGDMISPITELTLTASSCVYPSTTTTTTSSTTTTTIPGTTTTTTSTTTTTINVHCTTRPANGKVYLIIKDIVNKDDDNDMGLIGVAVKATYSEPKSDGDKVFKGYILNRVTGISYDGSIGMQYGWIPLGFTSCAGTWTIDAVKDGYQPNIGSTVEINTNEENKPKYLFLTKTPASSVSVGMECHAKSDGAAYGARAECTFNNIPYIDGKDYDELYFKYNAYDSVASMDPAISFSSNLLGSVFPKGYSGKVTLQFEDIRSTKCTELEADYWTLSPLYDSRVNFDWNNLVSSKTTFYVKRDGTSHTVYVCMSKNINTKKFDIDVTFRDTAFLSTNDISGNNAIADGVVLFDCYTDDDCNSAVGGGTCVDNMCSDRPFFTDGYPISVVDMNNNPAVHLKWSMPRICDPNQIVCVNPSDVRFNVNRVSISPGSFQSSVVPIVVASDRLDAYDDFIDLYGKTGVTKAGFIGKTVTYSVEVIYNFLGITYTSPAATTSVVISSCVLGAAFDNVLTCKGTATCLVDTTGICIDSTPSSCSSVDCHTMTDCYNNGCGSGYICALPVGGIHTKCLSSAERCSISPSMPVPCVSSLKYCGDYDNVRSWARQNDPNSGVSAGAFYDMNYSSVEAFCINKILSTDQAYLNKKCYDDAMCGSGMTCPGALLYNDGTLMTCVFDYNSKTPNQCVLDSSTKGYCYPDGKCHKTEGGVCDSTVYAACDPNAPNCPSTQFCDSDTHKCNNKLECAIGTLPCTSNSQCECGSCMPINPSFPYDGSVCKPVAASATCDYSLCANGQNRGADCNCGVGKICVPNDWLNSANWKYGTCKDALANGAQCGSDNIFGAPDSFLIQRANYNEDTRADWLCASGNCLGDIYKANGKITAICQPWAKFCDANTLVATNVLDPEHYCRCSVYDVGDTFPCAVVTGTNLDNDLKAVANNPSWCYNEPISGASQPSGFATPTFSCFKKYAGGLACVKNYQCSSGKCVGGICGDVPTSGKLDSPCTVTNILGQSDVIWNWFGSGMSNPETNTMFWGDNCGTDPSKGPLYCEPCNYQDQKMYDVEYAGSRMDCVDVSVKMGTPGRCRPVQNEGDWCYSTSQCSPERKQVGNSFQALQCMTDPSHPMACSKSQSPPNWYCQASNVNTFNKFCIYKTVGGCVHDSLQPWGQFTTYADDTCYTMSKVGDAPANTFCDDSNMCIVGSSTSKCQDLSVSARASATPVKGNCMINRCPVPGDGIPYQSDDCWREPGFSDPNHNVAPAIAPSLVYCSSSGQCMWKKSVGIACSYDTECDSNYICTSAKVCGVQSCKTDSDCKYGDTRKCINGQCKFQGINEFTVTANNGLAKPVGSPQTLNFDLVMNCAEHDTWVTATSSNTMAVMVSKSGQETYLGDSKTVQSTKISGDLYDTICSTDLIQNTVLLGGKTVTMDFIPVISGVKGTSVTKTIMVLSRPLSVRVVRCAAGNSEPLCVGKQKDSFVIASNNTLYGQVAPYLRRISCDSAQMAGTPYVTPIYPRSSFDVFGDYSFAVISDWTKEKYFKCTDEYGSVKLGSTLVNPAEYIFSLQFTRSQQIFILLVILLGIPVLVLIGSRVGGKGR